MNCDLCRRRLLAGDRPAGPVALHLAACAACRAWYRPLAALERDLPCLPVPDASAARDRLLATLRDLPPAPRVVAPRRWQPCRCASPYPDRI